MIVLAIAGLCLASAPAGAIAPTPTPTPAAKASGAAPSSSAGQSPNEATFGIQAASATAGDTRPDFTFGGTSGSVISDHVAVSNIGDVPLDLELYPTDAIATSDGSFAIELGLTKPTDLGSWITMNTARQITIPARTAKGPTTMIVPFTVSVPSDATPGDHAGAIVVSLHTAAGVSGPASEALDQRVGIRVYFRVAGPIHAGLSIQKLSPTFLRGSSLYNPFGRGSVRMTYEIRNTGNVILGGKQDVKVSGLIGGSTTATTVDGKPLAQIPALLPGGSMKFTALAKDVFPSFRVTTTVRVTPLVPVGQIDPGIVVASASVTVWGIPWALVVLILIVLGACGWLIWRRRHPSRKTGRHGPPPKNRERVPVSA